MGLERETEGADDGGLYFRLQGCIASAILGKTKKKIRRIYTSLFCKFVRAYCFHCQCMSLQPAV
jgi:hypothetical protein